MSLTLSRMVGESIVLWIEHQELGVLLLQEIRGCSASLRLEFSTDTLLARDKNLKELFDGSTPLGDGEELSGLVLSFKEGDCLWIGMPGSNKTVLGAILVAQIGTRRVKLTFNLPEMVKIVRAEKDSDEAEISSAAPL